MHPLLVAALLVRKPHVYADQSNTPLLVVGIFLLMLIIPCLMTFETSSEE